VNKVLHKLPDNAIYVATILKICKSDHFSLHVTHTLCC